VKRLDDTVARKLGEILVKHGRSSLTDAQLCGNLLNDYCGEHKEEKSFLVLGVKERVAIDLIVSQDGLPRDFLRELLTKRLRRNLSLTEGEARWIVDSWSVAVRTLLRAEMKSPPAEEQPAGGAIPSPSKLVPQSGQPFEPAAPKFGIIGKCEKAIRSVDCSPGAPIVASGSEDGSVHLWNTLTGEARLLSQDSDSVSSVAFSPNGVLLATASEGIGSTKGRIRVWDLQPGEALDLGESGERSPSVVFSPGGRRLASGSAEPDGVIRVWNLQSGQLRTLKGPWGGPASIAFSPDGRWIAAADAALTNTTIRLWDLETGTASTLGQCTRQVTSLSFSLDGKTLASGSWDEMVRLWDLHTQAVTVLARNCSCICCLSFSPRGDQLAACSLDSRIRVWDLTTAKARTVGSCDNINALAFSSDGRVLVTGSSDGTVRLWDAMPRRASMRKSGLNEPGNFSL